MVAQKFIESLIETSAKFIFSPSMTYQDISNDNMIRTDKPLSFLFVI